MVARSALEEGLRTRVVQKKSDKSNLGYRRGAVMGLTLAEAFVLITFAVLMLLALWRLKVDEERARYAGLESLSPSELVASRELSAAGQLEAAATIVAGGANLAVVSSRLVELERGRLSEAQMAAALILVESGQLEAASRLASQGLVLTRQTGLPDEAERWRLIDRDELLRIVDSFEDLPEHLQHDLADMVEVENPEELARIIEATRRATVQTPPPNPLAEVDAIRRRVDLSRAATVQRLREQLSASLSSIEGARIRNDGTIVLPESVSFAVGKWDMSPQFREFLTTTCEPWLRTLMASEASISGATIEGHTDSTWGNSSPEEAYLLNLHLSQQRSAAVLGVCLENISDPSVRTWAQEHLVSIAYSSARPLLGSDGREDAAASRRVEFSIQFDDGEVLEEISRTAGAREGVTETNAASEQLGTAQISGRVVHVRDGDTFVVSVAEFNNLEFPIRLSGVNCEELGSVGGNAAADYVRESLENRDVVCQLDGSRTGDRYAGTCELIGDNDVGETLIREGYCGRCAAYDPLGRYLEAESAASPWTGAVPAYCYSD